MMTSFHHLPEEIIENIIVKLPLKSIIRFQSLSKTWFGVIKSDRFIYKHLIENKESFLALCFIHQSDQPDRFFLDVFVYDDDEEEVSGIKVLCDSQKLAANYRPVINFELPFSYDFRSQVELVGNCNGTLCFTDYHDILLVNPLTKEVKTLPRRIIRGHCILVGLGFDNATMDFKVVKVSTFGRHREAEVYNLRTNAWRKGALFPFALEVYNNSLNRRYTFFNGAIHWCSRIQPFGWRILTFDMATELFGIIEFAQDWYDDNYYHDTRPALFVLNQESLAFVSFYHMYVNRFVTIWTMNNKHENNKVTWVKLYSIVPTPELMYPLGFLKKHKLIYYETKGKIVLYDLLSHRRSVVCEWNHRKNANCYKELSLKMQAGVCGSSLVSINM